MGDRRTREGRDGAVRGRKIELVDSVDCLVTLLSSSDRFEGGRCQGHCNDRGRKLSRDLSCQRVEASPAPPGEGGVQQTAQTFLLGKEEGYSLSCPSSLGINLLLDDVGDFHCLASRIANSEPDCLPPLLIVLHFFVSFLEMTMSGTLGSQIR